MLNQEIIDVKFILDTEAICSLCFKVIFICKNRSIMLTKDYQRDTTLLAVNRRRSYLLANLYGAMAAVTIGVLSTDNRLKAGHR